MYTPEQYLQAEQFRAAWYKSKGYPMDLSWASLDAGAKDGWVREMISFNTDDTQQEVVE